MSGENEMRAALVTLIAETHIHPGVGQSTGALDLPVARERTTQYPFIPGSGVKGAYRVWATEKATGLQVKTLFGRGSGDDSGAVDGAGGLLCADARLLLLPVRCLSDAYKWVTCPAILHRLQRDNDRAGNKSIIWELAEPGAGKHLGVGTTDDWLGLEEREFRNAGTIAPTVISALEKLIGSDMASGLAEKLIILSDRDFTWFAQYGLPIMARNVLDKDKISTNLWYEETLAPDTIMYVLFGERSPGQVKNFTSAIPSAPYVQMGGNETIGQGWFKMVPYVGSAL